MSAAAGRMSDLQDRAAAQLGYFTSADAAEAGFSRALVNYYVRKGDFVRVRRGLLRLGTHPPSPEGRLVGEWLALGAAGERMAVSHESALFLHSLMDAPPASVHLTVARNLRRSSRPGVVFHSSRTSPAPDATESVAYSGVRMRVTAPLRAIVDAASAGAGAEVVVTAVQRGLAANKFDRTDLLLASQAASARVSRLIAKALRSNASA